MSRQPTIVRRPYPGLRAFRRDESDLFFGREGSVNEMVDRMAQQRFLAVLGPSGCGKSSLVRTGLFDALDLGFLHSAGSDWLIVDMHPADQPLKQLAAALLKAVSPSEPAPTEVKALAKRLRQGPRSLAKWAGEGQVPDGTNLLVLVDQFEELFTYAKFSQREEAEAFVALLLESVVSKLCPIYVVITMRSEYLGACSSIHELAEYISKGLYLTPRLERESCRAAIQGPADVIGFELEPALVNRMLNDLATLTIQYGEETEDLATRLALQADELPLMQHVLNRLWLRAEGLPHEGRVLLTLAEYNVLGGMEGAIDAHGQEIMNDLSEPARAAAEPIFRALVSGNSLATAVRRPASIGQLVALAGGEEARPAVLEVVEAFRSLDNNFLRTSAMELRDGTSAHLEDDTLIDITHESLIRQWSTLRTWLNDEIRDDTQWRRLLARRNEGDLLTGPSLDNFSTWWQAAQPTPAWAERHGGHFEEVQSFLRRSTHEARRRRRRQQQMLWGIPAAITLFLLFAGTGFYFQYVRLRSDQAALQALSTQDLIRQQELKAKLQEVEEARQNASDSQKRAADMLLKADTTENALDMTLGARNSQDPRRELYWLRALDTKMKFGHEEANATQMTPETAARLKELYASALSTTQGQVAFLGGAHGHHGAIKAVWFTPDGRWILTRGDDRKVIVWDAATGRAQATLGPAPADLVSARSSPDGRLVVTTTDTGTATVYEVPSGRRLVTFSPTPGTSQSMFDASFSNDGKLLATGTLDGIVRVWNVPAQPVQKDVTQPLADLHSPQEDTAVIFRVAFIAGGDGHLLLAVEDVPSSDVQKQTGMARVWNYKTGKAVSERQLGNGYLNVVDYDAAGDFILAGPGDARVWTPSRDAGFHLPGATNVRHAAISHNGQWVITAGGKDARLWSTVSPTSHLLTGHTQDINEVSFSPDDRLVVTAGDDGSAKVWSVATRELVATLAVTGHLNAVRFSPNDHDRVLTAGEDGTALLWSLKQAFHPLETIYETHPLIDLALSPSDTLAVLATNNGALVYNRQTHRQITLESGHMVRQIDLSTDGRLAVTADGDKASASVWNLQSGARAYAPLKGSDDAVTRAKFSPDGRWLVTITKNNAFVWHAADGRAAFTITVGGKMIYDVNFDPGSHNVLVAANDNTADVYNLATTEEKFLPLRHQNQVTRASYSRDGRHILTCSLDGTAKVWDAASGRLLRSFQSMTPLREARFSPNGRLIATSGDNGAIDLWDVGASSGKPLRSMQGQTGTVFSTEFNSTGTLLATTSDNGRVFVWNVATGSEIVSFDEGPAVNETIFAHHDPYLLAVASSDGRATMWRVHPEQRSLEQLAAEAREPRLTPDAATQQIYQQDMVAAPGTAGTHETKSTLDKGKIK